MDNTDVTKGKKNKVAQVQNVPKKLRDAIVPDPGMVMIGGDWAAIEWCLVQYFAAKLDDPPGFHEALLQRFQAGGMDPHRYLAGVALGKGEGEVTDGERSEHKPYTHGLNFYGAGRTIARQVGQKDKEGVKVQAAHLEAFRPQAWWRHELALAQSRHYIETPLGWRRWFWEYKPKPTEVLASIVQGTAADLMKWVSREVLDEAPDMGAEVLTTTHDSFLLQCSADYEQPTVVWLKNKMQQPIPWLDNRSWRADVKSGRSWREVS